MPLSAADPGHGPACAYRRCGRPQTISTTGTSSPLRWSSRPSWFPGTTTGSTSTTPGSRPCGSRTSAPGRPTWSRTAATSSASNTPSTRATSRGTRADELLVEQGKARVGPSWARGPDPGGGRVTWCACPRPTRTTTPTTGANVETIRTWLGRNAANVYPVGRNGMHRYNNQDHSMYTAMLTVENILGARPRRVVGQRRGGVPRDQREADASGAGRIRNRPRRSRVAEEERGHLAVTLVRRPRSFNDRRMSASRSFINCIKMDGCKYMETPKFSLVRELR